MVIQGKHRVNAIKIPSQSISHLLARLKPSVAKEQWGRGNVFKKSLPVSPQEDQLTHLRVDNKAWRAFIMLYLL